LLHAIDHDIRQMLVQEFAGSFLAAHAPHMGKSFKERMASRSSITVGRARRGSCSFR
jgi:hypothetical protein